MKRAFRLSSQVPWFALALGATLAGPLGCSGSTATGDPSTGAPLVAPPGTRIAPVAVAAKSSRVRMMADALSSVPLRDDQRAEIEQLASDADARHAKGAAGRAEIMVGIAAQVEAGKLDRAALQSKIDAAADASNAARPADQAALQRVHALLTPEQRGQVADAMAAHHKAAHAEHAHGSHRDRMEKWATDLKLTDVQRAQIGALLLSQRGDHAEHRADFKAMHDHGRGDGFAESFRSETLVMHAPDDAHVHANAMADHVFKIAETVLPLLTAEQRALAGAKLRERAAGGEEDAPLGE